MSEFAEKYDVVIIGSGLGGLECGYILTKEGKKVCILEKNRQLGGSLQIFSREKAIFDTGIHYIGGLDEGQNLNQYFKYFGLMDKLKLKKMDENGFDIISFTGDETYYPHAQGYDNFVNVLSEYFPGERANIQKYVDIVRETCDFFPLYRVKDEKKDLVMAEFLATDTKAWLETITPNKKLQNVLAGSNPLYAGEADKTPMYVHALVVNTYIESAYRCIDGGGQIAKHLSGAIKSMGGDIFNYAEASKFHFSGDRISEVELSDGRKIKGDYFISNCDISRTLDMIEPGHVRQAYRSRINSLENSISTFILYLVLEEESMPYFNYNMYHHHVDDVWDGIKYTKDNWPHGFALFSQASSKNPAYTDSLIVMTYMSYGEVAEWTGTKNIIPNHIVERGSAYDEFKIRKSEKIIDAIEKRIPGVRKKIKSYYSSSPLTFRDYMGNRDGSLYGIKKDYKDPLKTFITPKTRVPNLFLTGQNLNLHGVLGVTVSSVVSCAELIDQSYLVKKIQQAT